MPSPPQDLRGATAIRMLSVVMPVYNEEAAIESVILEHRDLLHGLHENVPEWEIVCVDDGSVDRTPEILRNLQVRVPELRVIRQENQGIYGAMARVFQEARGTHVYNTGSDGQWPAKNLETMLPAVAGGADLVVGVRKNRQEVYSPARRLISGCFNLLPRILFGTPVEDAGGSKLGVREIFRYDLISRSVFSEAERIILAHRQGMRIEFVPIDFVTRKGGKALGASWKNVRSSVRDLFRCLYAYGFR
jgi:glycosyltransferase involved in cell wall biosynthesis